MKLFKSYVYLTFTMIILLTLFIYYRKFPNDISKHLNEFESADNSAKNSENITTNLKRFKRFLIFQGGGVVKVSPKKLFNILKKKIVIMIDVQIILLIDQLNVENC